MSEIQLMADRAVFEIDQLADRLSELYRTAEGREVLEANHAKITAAWHRLGNLMTLADPMMAA